MEALQLLSRNEMKQIMGGLNECANGCLSLYGGYYEECLQTYGPTSDDRMPCIDEVHDMSISCLNGCF